MQSSFLPLVKKSLGILYKFEDKHLITNTLLIGIGSFLDLLGVTALIPTIALVTSPEKLESLPFIAEFLANNSFSFKHLSVVFLLTFILIFAIKSWIVLRISKLTLKWNQKVATALTIALFKQAYSDGFSKFFGGNEHKIAQKLMSFPVEFVSAVRQNLLGSSIELLFIILLNLAIAYWFPLLFLLFIAFIAPVLWFLGRTLGKSSRRYGNQRYQLAPKSSQHAHQLFRSYIEFKTFGAEDFFIEAYASAFSKLHRVINKAQSLNLYPKRVIETLGVSIIGGISLYFIVYEVPKENFILLITAFALAAYRLFPAFIMLVNLVVNLKAKATIIDFLHEHLVQKSENNNQIIRTIPLPNFEKIIIKNASLSRGNELLLNDINFELNKGNIIGLSGKSGSGKSSLTKAIMGFISLKDNSINLNDKPLEELDLSSYQRIFAYISAESSFLNSGIYENVCLNYSVSQTQKNAIDDLLKLVKLEDFINNNRPIGEFGNMLSTGQKQRLALARALFFEPKILILDEFTAHLDIETATLLLQLITELNRKEELTILLISHQKSALAICNSVYEIKNKKLSIT